MSSRGPGTSLPGRGSRGRDPTTAPPQGRGDAQRHKGDRRGTQAGGGRSAGVPESWPRTGRGRGVSVSPVPPPPQPPRVPRRAGPGRCARSFHYLEAPCQTRACRPTGDCRGQARGVERASDGGRSARALATTNPKSEEKPVAPPASASRIEAVEVGAEPSVARDTHRGSQPKKGKRVAVGQY